MGSHKVGLVLAVHPRLQQCLLCLCCIGYPISDATWELEDNLVQDVLDLLKAYQKEKMLFSSHKEVELPKLPKTRSTSRSPCLEGRGGASSVQGTEGVAEGTLQVEGGGVQQCWLQGSIFAS